MTVLDKVKLLLRMQKFQVYGYVHEITAVTV